MLENNYIAFDCTANNLLAIRNLGWIAWGLKSDFSNITDAVYSDNSGLSSLKGFHMLVSFKSQSYRDIWV